MFFLTKKDGDELLEKIVKFLNDDLKPYLEHLPTCNIK